MACHACGLYYPAACKTCGAIGDLSECGGLTRSAARIMMLSEPDFEAKLAEIRARGAARIAEAQAKEHATTPPANVGDRHHLTGLPCAPVGDVGAEREALPVHGNERVALAFQRAKELLDQLSDDDRADVLRLLRQRFAEDGRRIVARAGVVTWNGQG